MMNKEFQQNKIIFVMPGKRQQRWWQDWKLYPVRCSCSLCSLERRRLSTASWEVGVVREVMSSLLLDPVVKGCEWLRVVSGQVWRFGLDIRKHFFTESMVRCCNRLLQYVDNTSRLSVFKRYLSNILKAMWSAMKWSGSWTELPL